VQAQLQAVSVGKQCHWNLIVRGHVLSVISGATLKVCKLFRLLVHTQKWFQCFIADCASLPAYAELLAGCMYYQSWQAYQPTHRCARVTHTVWL
jgi:hypothetical protein